MPHLSRRGERGGLTPAPHTVYVQQPVHVPKVYGHYSGKASVVLGILQIMCGIITVGLNIALLVFRATGAYVATGLWSGPIFIIAGAFGIEAGRHKTKCTIVTTMVFSILAPFFCASIIAVHVLGALCDGAEYQYYDQSYYPRCDVKWVRYDDGLDKIRIILASVIGAFAVVEAILAIAHGGICCSGVCCGTIEMRYQPLSVPMEYSGEQPGGQVSLGPIQGQSTVNVSTQSPQTTAQQVSTHIGAGNSHGVGQMGLSASPPPQYQLQAPVHTRQAPAKAQCGRTNLAFVGQQAVNPIIQEPMVGLVIEGAQIQQLASTQGDLFQQSFPVQQVQGTNIQQPVSTQQSQGALRHVQQNPSGAHLQEPITTHQGPGVQLQGPVTTQQGPGAQLQGPISVQHNQEAPPQEASTFQLVQTPVQQDVSQSQQDVDTLLLDL